MPDPLHLSCWLRGFSENNMFRAYEKLLRLFPYSLLSKLPSTFRVMAIDLTLPAVFERGLPSPPNPDDILAAARDFKNPDGSYELETWWDLWQYYAGESGGDWRLLPARVSLACFGPQFDNEMNDNLRVDLGPDSHFLPQPYLPDHLPMVRANVESLLKLTHDADAVLNPEKRLLWTESGTNFVDRMRLALQETATRSPAVSDPD